jgi:hypothetical protein
VDEEQDAPVEPGGSRVIPAAVLVALSLFVAAVPALLLAGWWFRDIRFWGLALMISGVNLGLVVPISILIAVDAECPYGLRLWAYALAVTAPVCPAVLFYIVVGK